MLGRGDHVAGVPLSWRRDQIGLVGCTRSPGQVVHAPERRRSLLTGQETLSQPFPHTAAFNPAAGLPDPPDEADVDSEEEHNDAVVYSPGHTVGLLYLCHLRCAYREALVVSGPTRGQMWADDTADDGGFRPLREGDGNPTGFSRWYRRWLEQAEEQLRTAQI